MDNVQQALQKAGGANNLPTIDGPRLESFDALGLASALESEIERAGRENWPKISLHMDIADAKALAAALRTVK